MTRTDRTPSYPRYLGGATGPRTCAYLLGHALYTERAVDQETGEVHEAEILAVDPWTWEHLCDLIYTHNLQVWVDDISVALGPLLPACLAECGLSASERKGRQWCELSFDPDEGSDILAVSIHRRQNQRHLNLAGRWVADGEQWQIETSSREENLAWMARIRWLCCDALGVGIKGTPGSAGEAVIRATFAEHGLRREMRPWLHCIERLETCSIGSRMELYAEPGIIHDVAYRADMSGAYPAFAGRLPTGHIGYLSGRDSLTERLLFPLDGSAPSIDSATWFAEALIQIEEPGIPAGDVLPFGFKRWRAEQQRYEVVYPTAPGWYGGKLDEPLYLWREQAEELVRLRREEGLPVRIVALGEAFVWPEWCDSLKHWAKRMEAARINAPTRAAEKLVKLATVAGWGRLGMHYHTRQLVRYGDADPHTDEPLVTQAGETLPDAWFIRREDADPGTPKHWHAYVLMRCTLAMSQAMHEYHRRTGLGPLACYVDEMELPTHPGAEYDDAQWRMGGWKTKPLHDWVGYAPGHIHALEEQRMPGVDAWRKAQLYRWGEPREKRRKHLNEEAGAIRFALMDSERFRRIQAERIAPYYAEAAAVEERERLRREALAPLREQAEAQLRRESWRLRWAERK